MSSVLDAVISGLVGSAVHLDSPLDPVDVVARMQDASVRGWRGPRPGELFVQARTLDPSRPQVRVAAVKQGTKNGNAPEFSGTLRRTPGGSRLDGVIRFARGTRVTLVVMFAVPMWALIAGLLIHPRGPAGWIAFILLVTLVLTAFVVFMALGFRQRESHLRDWLSAATLPVPPTT